MKVISFPHLGNYYIPIKFLLSKLTHHTIKESPPITKKTLELGSLYSPDYVCIPFKYCLGNFIEALDSGADTIVQAGGGCRFAYYGEVQRRILESIGYKFSFYSLADEHAKINIKTIYKTLKEINDGKLNIFKYSYFITLSALMVKFMDNTDHFIRKNIGFEIKHNSFINLQKEMLNEFSSTKGFIDLIKKYFKYKKLFKKIEINKPTNPLKVGIIGELYTAIEPFSTYNLEYTLAKMNIEVTRFTNLFYLVITKFFTKKRELKKAHKYLKYPIGADADANVSRSIWLARNHYDGIIHTKPFGCTPEVGAIPIIAKVARDYNIPIIYLTFDSQTSEEGIKTRIEAFYDMILMKRRGR